MSSKRISMLRRIWLPPIPFALAALSMAGLDAWLPGWRFDSRPLRFMGAGCVLAGLSHGLYALHLFRQSNTSMMLFRPPSCVVVTGPYRYTRNPMYLGLVLALIGWTLILGSISPLAVVPLFMWVMTVSVIHFEERRLADLFGEAYLGYCRRVRRWL